MAITKQALEKAVKESFMERLIETLQNGELEVSRVTDYGTLAIPVKVGEEDRYVTLKVVLTKTYDEEKMTGFDIFDAENAYAERVKADEDKAKAKEAKAKENLAKKAKREADAKAKKEKEASAQKNAAPAE